jgi:ankyrin repeat protein
LKQAISQGSGCWFREGGASIEGTSESISALEYAAVLGKILIVEWLLAKGGANISEVDERGFTALLCAAKNIHLTDGHIQTVGWLLEHGGADITDII